MRQALLLPAALLFAIALLASPTLAQETTGRLEGRVLDAQGQPVADVSVGVTSPSLQGGRGCLTSARGTFLLLALPVGEYRVKLQHLAYQTQVFEEVRVRLGQTTSLGDIHLGDKVLDQPEVSVSAKRPLIDPNSTDLGGVLATKECEALPIARDYRSVAVLLPEANLSFLGDPINFAGATGLENRFFIDGVDVTNPWAFKDATGLPYNFVEEVEVRTGSYEAQYRSALGGTVNAITYSGGNSVKAQAFGFYTQNRIVADRPRYSLRPDSKDFALYDIGLGVGGPVLRDRLWYYLAYNPTVTVEDVPVQGWGYFEDKAVTHNFAAKLTWRANADNTVIFNAFGDPTDRRAVGDPIGDVGLADATLASPDPALQRVTTGGVSLSLEGRHTLRQNLLLESAVSFGTHQAEYGPDSDEAAGEMPFTDEIAGALSGGSPYPSKEQNQVFLARLAATWWKDSHEFKAGFEYKDAQDNMGFLGGADLRLTLDSTWIYHAYGNSGRAGNRIPSLFLQDGWRISQRIRLNLGLRWESVYIISTERQVAQTLADEWQPRLGITWDVNGSGVQKVSASFGRFYHDLPIWPHFWYYNSSNYDSTIYYQHDPRIDPTLVPGDSAAVSRNSGYIQPEIDGMQGQYFDEFSLGYERRIGPLGKFGVRGIYRTLRQALEDGTIDTVQWSGVWGNPGREPMTIYPRATRNYMALELNWQGRLSTRLNTLASYVLSRNYGNYTGLTDTDWGWDFPNANGQFDLPWLLINGEGLLPNDRSHVFKLSGSYIVGGGLTLGMIGLWESGTPLSQFGSYPNVMGRWSWGVGDLFIAQRGTAGRTPSLWDLNLRIGYQPPLPATSRIKPKLTLDFLHIASQKRPVTFDQLVYRLNYNYDDGTWTTIMNPNYGKATQWQPGMAARFGAEVQF